MKAIDMTAPWVWNDETEAVVAQLLRDHPSLKYRDKKSAIRWAVNTARFRLRDKADIDMIASAVAAHLSGHPEELRKR